MGVNPAELTGRFNFITRTAELDELNPWSSLDKDLDGLIPAIADQTIIQWGLGKKTGDTLIYQSETGKKMYLKLIGGLANSIFQGNIIISNNNFLNHFPSSSGSHVFLIDGNTLSANEIRNNLSFVFRDYGWQLDKTTEKLAEFYSVENTYLQIFLILGSFGLLLGTIGLAIILARSMLERKNEIALLKATGYPTPIIFRIFFREYLFLLISGVICGALTATIAVFPTILSGTSDISLKFLLFLIFIILVNGIAWIILIFLLQNKKIQLIEALRND